MSRGQGETPVYHFRPRVWYTVSVSVGTLNRVNLIASQVHPTLPGRNLEAGTAPAADDSPAAGAHLVLRKCPKCGYPGGLIRCPNCHGVYNGSNGCNGSQKEGVNANR